MLQFTSGEIYWLASVFSEPSLRRDENGNMLPPEKPKMTPELEEFMKQNNLPNFDQAELFRRVEQKLKDKKKLVEGNNDTVYEAVRKIYESEIVEVA